MRRLFRSFDRSGVEYLLISGQASILYGAATFSEDVDIWLKPTPENVRRFLRALASCGARVHKLTPPLEMRFLRRGHGFHFRIPARPDPLYLDVMGCPPRVGSFAASARRARRMTTGWGTLPVVSIEDLVALKKTRRLADYEVISNLVAIRLAEEDRPSKVLLRWAAANAFRAEDRAAYRRLLGVASSVERCRREILRDIDALQREDTIYWRRRIAELRRLRRAGLLLPQGAPAKRA